MNNIEREKIDLTEEELLDLWDGVYFVNSVYNLRGVDYKHVMVINTSDNSDGPSWDYIIQRVGDGRFFKFHIWDAGKNGYIFEKKYIIEVFEKQTVTYE